MKPGALLLPIAIPAGRWRLALAAALAVFAALAVDLLLQGPVTGADAVVSKWFVANRTPVATQFLLAVTHLHSTLGICLMSAALAVAIAATGRGHWIPGLVVVLQGALILNPLMKLLFGRARPVWDQPLLVLSSASFPSGHAVGATVFWGFLGVIVWSLHRAASTRLAIVVLGLAMVALTALSRIYLGAHYLSDVLAGVAVGIAWLAICLLLLGRRVEPGGQRKPP